MKHDEFGALLGQIMERTRKVLASKNAEYASADDKFHNFKRVAGITGQRPEQVCVGFMVKHLVSVLDLVEQPARLTCEKIEEKVGDAINYLILLEGLLRERLQDTKEAK